MNDGCKACGHSMSDLISKAQYLKIRHENSLLDGAVTYTQERLDNMAKHIANAIEEIEQCK